MSSKGVIVWLKHVMLSVSEREYLLYPLMHTDPQ